MVLLGVHQAWPAWSRRESAESDWSPGALGVAWDEVTLQDNYDAGNGPSPDDATGLKQYPPNSAQAADYVRRDPRFRDVYLLYLQPKTFDLNSIEQPEHSELFSRDEIKYS